MGAHNTEPDPDVEAGLTFQMHYDQSNTTRDELWGYAWPAIDLKAEASAISEIDNTSDLNKPVSTATQAAIEPFTETFVPSGATVFTHNLNYYPSSILVLDETGAKQGAPVTNVTTTAVTVDVGSATITETWRVVIS